MLMFSNKIVLRLVAVLMGEATTKKKGIKRFKKWRGPLNKIASSPSRIPQIGDTSKAPFEKVYNVPNKSKSLEGTIL